MGSPPAAHPRRPVLTFVGGAGTVTGSRFLLQTPSSTLLVDCGLFQGLKELRQRNWAPFPIDPRAIDAVVLTHAHVDHTGYLPRLAARGFSGPVLCSEGTADLAEIILPDSGYLQEEEARFANKMGYSRHHPALPLYTEADARAALRLLRPVPFGETVEATEDLRLTLRPAGHILGAATVTVDLVEHGRSVLFTGDLGRGNHPILTPPAPPDAADVIVMESTYGGRHHDEEGAVVQLAEAISGTAARGGSVLIPAFAVDRTEVVLLRLRQLMDAGTIPTLPVHADSPMALSALAVYRRAILEGSADVRAELHGRTDLFDDGHLHEARDVEASKALATLTHPSIIVSASGMATGGRVLHHLARMLPDRRNTVVLVGYQAAGTRGRLLAEGRREIKMFGTYVPVRADIANIRSFSVHADHDELLGWLRSATRQPEVVYLVHGEPEGAQALRDAISDELDCPAVVARQLERVRLA